MEKQRFLRSKFVAAVLAAFASAATAETVQETTQAHDSIESAQQLTVFTDDGTGTGKGWAAVENASLTAGSADFYSFNAKIGDTVTIDIDGAEKAEGVPGSFDSFIAVYRDGNELAYDDDADSWDEGSDGMFGLDARIDNFPITQTGKYTVKVMGKEAGDSGTYKLVISGVSLPTTPEPDPSLVQKVDINFKPDQRRELVKPKRHGDIHVAVLSSGAFNALDVDVKTVTFGPTGTEARPTKCHWHGEKANRDRRGRLMCHFDSAAVGFRPSDVEGVIKGTLRTDSKPFEGRRTIKESRKKPHDKKGN